jgi:hypothetical protein
VVRTYKRNINDGTSLWDLLNGCMFHTAVKGSHFKPPCERSDDCHHSVLALYPATARWSNVRLICCRISESDIGVDLLVYTAALTRIIKNRINMLLRARCAVLSVGEGGGVIAHCMASMLTEADMGRWSIFVTPMLLFTRRTDC